MENQIKEKKEKVDKTSFTLGLLVGFSALSFLGLVILGIFTFSILKNIPSNLPLDLNGKSQNKGTTTLSQENSVKKEINKLNSVPEIRNSTESFVNLAKEIGLDSKKFETCLASKKYLDKIDQDKKEAEKLEIDGTPNFFINDQEIKGAYPFDKFKEIIDQELTKNNPKVKEGLILDNHPFQGEKNAKIVIVEFSDYQCPYCKKGKQIIEQILQEYKNKVKLIFKDLPFHSLSLEAAQATYCAQEQKKFWEMSNLLFEKQNEWTVE